MANTPHGGAETAIRGRAAASLRGGRRGFFWASSRRLAQGCREPLEPGIEFGKPKLEGKKTGSGQTMSGQNNRLDFQGGVSPPAATFPGSAERDALHTTQRRARLNRGQGTRLSSSKIAADYFVRVYLPTSSSLDSSRRPVVLRTLPPAPPARTGVHPKRHPRRSAITDYFVR